MGSKGHAAEVVGLSPSPPSVRLWHLTCPPLSALLAVSTWIERWTRSPLQAWEQPISRAIQGRCKGRLVALSTECPRDSASLASPSTVPWFCTLLAEAARSRRLLPKFLQHFPFVPPPFRRAV
jgi:hypothetical protein